MTSEQLATFLDAHPQCRDNRTVKAWVSLYNEGGWLESVDEMLLFLVEELAGKMDWYESDLKQYPLYRVVPHQHTAEELKELAAMGFVPGVSDVLRVGPEADAPEAHKGTA